MSARDDLIEIVTSSPESSGGDVVWATDLVDAHRAEVLAEIVDRLHEAGYLGPAQYLRDNEACFGEKASVAAPTAAPDFFQPGHTYTRSHHGHRIEFAVEHVTTAPGEGYRVAFGWRTAFGWPEEPFTTDDLDGWTDVTDTTQGDHT
jgi:hypothetical protein